MVIGWIGNKIVISFLLLGANFLFPFKVYSLLNSGQVLTDAIIVRRENITASVNGRLILKILSQTIIYN